MRGGFTHNFEIKSVSEEVDYNGLPGIFIEGYCAVWQPKDRGGDDWKLNFASGSASRKAVENYFRKNPVVMFNHGLDPGIGRQAIGTCVEGKVDDYGIWVKDFIQRPELGTALMNVYRAIKAGIYRSFSIAGQWLKDRKSTILELQDFKEHSVVTVPMMPEATFSLAKSVFEAAEKDMEIKEALELASEIKAGRSISQANSSTIRAAIEALQGLLNGGSSIEIEAEAPGMMGDKAACCGNKACCEKECCKGMGSCGPDCKCAKPMKKEAEASLTLLKGALNKMGDENKEKGAPPAGGVTLTDEQFKMFQDIMSERDQLAKEREAAKIAEQRLADEQKAAELKAQEEAQRQAEINVLVDQKLAAARSGTKFNFGGQGGATFNTPNVNKLGKDEFSFAKFAQFGLQGREWQYMDDMEKKYQIKAAYAESIGNTGGFLVPVEQSTEIVQLLRTQAVVRAMGVKVNQMKSNKLTKPRRVGSATTYWGAEGSTLTDGTPSTPYAQIIFNAKKLYCLVTVTKEQLADAANAEEDIRADIAAQMALAEDNAFLQGSGIGETPLGIINTVGINSITYATGAVSAGPELTNIMKATGVIRANAGKPNGAVFNPRINDYLLNVKDTNGQPAFGNLVGGYNWASMNLTQLSRNSNDPTQVETGNLLGMKSALTTQLAPAISSTTNATGPMIIGDWRFAEIGELQGIELEVDRSLGFKSDVVYIKATRRVDFALTLPTVFSVLSAFPAIDIA